MKDIFEFIIHNFNRILRNIKERNKLCYDFCQSIGGI